MILCISIICCYYICSGDGCIVPLGMPIDTGVHNPSGYTLNYNGTYALSIQEPYYYSCGLFPEFYSPMKLNPPLQSDITFLSQLIVIHSTE